MFEDRLVLRAQPPVTDEVLAAVESRCAGPLPGALVALWRTTFGGRLYYDLRADLGGHDVALSFAELFYPDSGAYDGLWGWIDHECALAAEHQPGWSGRLVHLPIGGFEYLDRVYVRTAEGPDHGAVVAWQQGLPAGWELVAGDRAAPLAGDLRALFGRLALERDPWEADNTAGAELRYAVDDLHDSGDPRVRELAEKLRRLVRSSVLDWRGALDRGTLIEERRLRRLALERAAAADDLALLERLVASGCDPAEEVGGGLTPVDVALRHRSSTVTRWLVDRGVPVGNSLRVGAHAVDADLARHLLDRGAAVDATALDRALHNDDIAVVQALAEAVRPDDGLRRLGLRLRQLAAQAALAGRHAAARSDAKAAAREQRRSEILKDLAGRFDPPAAR
ncbi:ankyrin repeat domain-containing protein [Dactylosporangium cerinum]